MIEPNMWHLRSGRGIRGHLPSGKNKPLDGDDRLIAVDLTKTEPKWYYRIGDPMGWGVPVEDLHVVKRFRWHAGTVIDFHNWNSYRFVSERFKSVVELFEPGLHQFFPVDFVGVRGALTAKMYVLVPNVALRCFSKLSIGYYPIGWDKWGDHIWHLEESCRRSHRIYEDRPTKGHHLWVAVDVGNRPVMVSNELKNAMVRAGLTNLEFSAAESRESMRWMLPKLIKSRFAVDPPWQQFLDAEAEEFEQVSGVGS